MRWLLLPLLAESIWACSSCNAGNSKTVQTRLVRRAQPGSLEASSRPREPLEWGQLNFIQTTDTHGWLQGHLKEQNYGADWGDFVSFTQAMRRKADTLGVDLLLVDTGDLHDGTGLSDSTSPNGVASNPIFETLDFDLLTIGNHELYVLDIAREHFNQFSKFYGEKYLTSNVEILNPATGIYEYIGSKYRYFTTPRGLRIMAFGVIFDFKSVNGTRITKGADMVKQKWFQDAVDYDKPIDIFVVLGHNPIRSNSSPGTLELVFREIRKRKPDTPIQVFGGHTHIRDFIVYDDKSTGLEAGAYCETVGWLSMNGLSTNIYNNALLSQVPTSSRSAPSQKGAANSLPGSLKYSRRYLDWNRRTFEYHANGSQVASFDSDKGRAVTDLITEKRKDLELNTLYGCAPQSWCMKCVPAGDDGNILTLVNKAVTEIIVNETRAHLPRAILVQPGNIRHDLTKGPFTLDDSYIVSPYKNKFQYLPDVPYSLASQVLQLLNSLKAKKARDVSSPYQDTSAPQLSHVNEICQNPPLPMVSNRHYRRSLVAAHQTIRTTAYHPGYTTSDDFGADGDDTLHSPITSNYTLPNFIQVNGAFPADGSDPKTVDLVSVDFAAQRYILPVLAGLGAKYTEADLSFYMPENFTSNSYLIEYAKRNWQTGMPNCAVASD